FFALIVIYFFSSVCHGLNESTVRIFFWWLSHPFFCRKNNFTRCILICIWKNIIFLLCLLFVLIKQCLPSFFLLHFSSGMEKNAFNVNIYFSFLVMIVISKHR